jgi:hypothetical protein
MKKIIITIQPQGTVDVESKTCKKGSSVFFFFLGGGGAYYPLSLSERFPNVL